MSERMHTMDARWEQFDGLRFFAIIIIIASHAGAFGLYGQGSVVVSLFFVISGFFITIPMKDNGEEKFASVKGWIDYYLLRIVRIIPLYWMVVIFFYWISDTAMADKKALFDNLIFYNTYGHLWYLQHEVVCYLLAPFVIYIIYLVKSKCSKPGKLNIYIGVLLFVCGIILSKYLFGTAHFCLLWNGEKRQLRFGLFVMGMGIGYVVKGLRNIAINNSALICAMDATEAVLMFLLSFGTSAAFLKRLNPALEEYYIGWYRPIFCTALSCMLVLLLAVNSKGIISRILKIKLFGRLGRASYGMYLIHFFLLEFLPQQPAKRFAMAVFFSVTAAVWLYENIEEVLYKRIKKACYGSIGHNEY